MIYHCFSLHFYFWIQMKHQLVHARSTLFRGLEALASQVVSPYCSVETALVVGRVKPNAFPAPIIRSVQGLSLPNLGPAISEEALDKLVHPK